MRRGEVWRYEPAVARPGQSTLRLIVTSDAVNANGDLPIVLAVHIVDTDPASLLAVRVAPHGWARALSVEPVTRRRLIERVSEADADTMDMVATALRAAMDL